MPVNWMDFSPVRCFRKCERVREASDAVFLDPATVPLLIVGAASPRVGLQLQTEISGRPFEVGQTDHGGPP
jgi:hypothetical protein